MTASPRTMNEPRGVGRRLVVKPRVMGRAMRHNRRRAMNSIVTYRQTHQYLSTDGVPYWLRDCL